MESILISPLVTKQIEHETFLLHCIVVAGKTAVFGHNKVSALLFNRPPQIRPFEYLQNCDLPALCKQVGTGNYRKMHLCLSSLWKANLDLGTCTVEQLEAIPYIGMKTSRYFIMYTRPEEQTNDIAVIDIHTLKRCQQDPWLRKRLKELGLKKIPKSTPPKTSKKQYLIIQQAVCEDAIRKNISSRQWDNTNWDEQSKSIDLSREKAIASLTLV